jgi:TonB family protein
VVNGKATSLALPEYPAAARSTRASGAVNVQILIGEDGKVITAQAISGLPVLQFAARDAACRSKFSPTTLAGQPVKVSGVLVYNFAP